MPAVLHLRDRFAKPVRRTCKIGHSPSRRHEREQVSDVVVITREVTLTVHGAGDDPEKWRSDHGVVRPSPRFGTARGFDEVGEHGALDGKPGDERTRRPEVVGVPHTRILDHDAERAGPLDPIADALMNVATQDDADLQLLVRVRKVPSAGGVRRGVEAERARRHVGPTTVTGSRFVHAIGRRCTGARHAAV